MTRCYIPSPHTTSRSRLPPPSAPPGAPSPDISTAPSPPPGSGARPEPLPSLSVPLPRLGLTVKVLAPQSASKVCDINADHGEAKTANYGLDGEYFEADLCAA